MSKNLTRKGLALGAVVALGSTLIAGSPALAAGEVVFAPSTGTSYNTFITEPLTLAASLAPGQVAGNIVQLKYAVTVPTGVTLTYKVNGGTAADLTASGSIAGSGSSTAANTLALNVKFTSAAVAPVATAESISVPVTAYLDSNSNNVADAGEFQQARTYGFKKYSEVVSTVALTAPLPGDLSVKATAVLADINVEQTAADTKVTFTAGSQSLTAAPGVAAGSTAGSYSETVTALAATNVVTARAYFKAVALGTAAVSATVPAASIIAPVSGPVASANAVAATAAATVAATVRTNSAFTVEATIKSAATGNPVLAGKAVTAVVTPSGTLSSTRTLSINGVVYNGTVALPTSIALTTDAAGKAKVDLVTVGFAATNTVAVAFKSENQTTTTTATLADAAFTAVSTAVGSAQRSIVEGGSTTFNFEVKDQFGVAIGSGARLSTVIGYTTPATVYSAVSGGLASVTVTDTTASTATAVTVVSTLETQNVSTSNWAVLSPSVVAATQTVNVTATALDFTLSPVATQNALLSTFTALTPSTVSNPGAAVTVSANGFTFRVVGSTTEFANSITLFSSSTGSVAVEAKSNTAGAQTVTFTAGSVVKTSVVTVGQAKVDSGASIDLASVPAYSLPGATLVVTGFVKDEFGNGVQTSGTGSVTGTTTPSFSVVYAGPGFVVGGAMPTATDASGKFSFTVIVGAADAGSAVVTVKYDADGTGTAKAEIAKTATTVIGAAPVVATGPVARVSGSTARMFVTIEGNTLARNVVIKVAGKTFKTLKGSAAKKSYAVAAPKGSHNVTVFVGGKLLITKSIVVK